MDKNETLNELLLELQNINTILDSSRLFKTNAVILFSNRRVLCENILRYFNLPYDGEYKKELRDFKDITIIIAYLKDKSRNNETATHC